MYSVLTQERGSAVRQGLVWEGHEGGYIIIVAGKKDDIDIIRRLPALPKSNPLYQPSQY